MIPRSEGLRQKTSVAWIGRERTAVAPSMTGRSSHGSRCAIVLASGQGRRMGGPKALLLAPDKTLTALHVERFAAVCDRVMVVCRADVARVLRSNLAIDPGNCQVIESEEPDVLGPAGSLRAAALAVEAADQWEEGATWFITPVDCLPASEATLRVLADELGDAQATRPRHGLRGGHPVLVRERILRTYLSDPVPLRDRLAALGNDCRDVAVEDPAVVTDLNTPDGLRDALGISPSFVEIQKR